MSAPVDVLAVIEAEIAELHGLPNSINARRKARLIAARDAMAELIEADKAYDDSRTDSSLKRAQASHRRALALARVGGAS